MPCIVCLREGCIKEFNVKRATGEKVDLTLAAICAGWTYGAWKSTDWISPTATFAKPTSAGSDFRKAILQGASLNATKISAPISEELSASEIELFCPRHPDALPAEALA